MKSATVVLAIICLHVAGPAHAYLDQVTAPEIVEVGRAFSVAVAGSHPDSCWDLIDYDHVVGDDVITLNVNTAYTAPPGVVCLTVLVPYDLVENMTIPSAGNWLLRVVEHTDDPGGPGQPDNVVELEITATGGVALPPLSWGTIKGRYR